MAGGGTLTGHKGQNPLSGQLDGLGRSQILCHQQEFAVRQLETHIAAENIINTVGHIPNVRGTGIHVLVVHSGKYLREFLAGIQCGNRSSRAILDGHIDAVQIVQIFQHQQLDFHNGSLLFADLDLSLFVQSRQLLTGSFQSGFKLCLFHGGIAGGNGQGALSLAVNNGRADGYAGEYRQTDTFFHKQLLTLPVRSRRPRW